MSREEWLKGSIWCPSVQTSRAIIDEDQHTNENTNEKINEKDPQEHQMCVCNTPDMLYIIFSTSLVMTRAWYISLRTVIGHGI